MGSVKETQAVRAKKGRIAPAAGPQEGDREDDASTVAASKKRWAVHLR